MSNRMRYKISDVARDRFYQMPKFLFEGELRSLSNDARVLYALLKDRHELSLRNQWVNTEGEVYLIFTREEMCDVLGCSEPTALKAVKQLKSAMLMDEVRQGLNKPNLIYLYYVEQNNNEFSVKSENSFASRPKNSLPPDPKNFCPNDTNLSNTNLNDTQSINHLTETKENKKRLIDGITESEYRDCEEIIKDNIDYEKMVADVEWTNPQTGVTVKQYDLEMLDEIVFIMLDTICSKKNTIKVGGEEKPAVVVKSQLLKLGYEHIEYVLENLYNNRTKVHNIRSYLLTTLYNAASSYKNNFQQDFNHSYHRGNDIQGAT